MTKTIIALTVTLAFAVPLVGGCKREGPAERAGKKLDDAAKGVREKFEHEGPAEKAGRKLDKAVDDATD
jgi:hypothetical protein